MIFIEPTAHEAALALRQQLLETRHAACQALAVGDRRRFRRLRGEVIMLRRHLAELGTRFNLLGNVMTDP